MDFAKVSSMLLHKDFSGLLTLEFSTLSMVTCRLSELVVNFK